MTETELTFEIDLLKTRVRNLETVTAKPTKEPINWRFVALMFYVGISAFMLLWKVCGMKISWFVALAPIWGAALIFALAIVYTLVVLLKEKWDESFGE